MSIRIVTNEVRLSFVHLFEPHSFGDAPERYSVMALIPKTDTETVARIEKAVAEAAKAHFGESIPMVLKSPLRDGDRDRDGGEFAGHYFINAKSKFAPQVVDQNVQPITDPAQVYSGCYGRVSLEFYAYSVSGNSGVAAGLGNVQKLRDGERLGGSAPTATADFGAPTGGAAADFLS